MTAEQDTQVIDISTSPCDDSLPGSDRLSILIVGNDVYATHALPMTGPIAIGRSSDNDIIINDPSISRDHAVLHVDGPLRIVDLGSANGTRIRDRTVTPHVPTEVSPNEPIGLGAVTIILQRRDNAIRTRRLRSHDYFEGRLEDECARAERYGSQFVLAHLTVDGASPDVAQEVFVRALRELDVVALFAPGEYEVLLVEASAAEATRVVSRLVEELARAGVRAHVGTASYPRNGRHAGLLVAHARGQARGDGVQDIDTGDIVVADERMRALHQLVGRIAGGDISVLLLGETGVGKEVIAESIHRRSPRAENPFLRLSCAALTETLLESELFGHERGAFTGATQSKPGLLEIAGGGTVFLDEIGEIGNSTQVKLLRVLEERSVLRVGGLKPRAIDVRFISATNRDLELEVRRGRFREDLYYRLNAMSVVIPPLRERNAEIELLARHYIARLTAAAGCPTLDISPDALALLRAYSWPGNIRELRNVIERALLLAGGADTIAVKDLPADRMRSTYTARIAPTLPPPLDLRDSADAPAETTYDDDDERSRILGALDACAGNQTRAAQTLGIARRTLINRLEKYGIRRPRKR
jgi:transcriptional regulator with GAF, ATPase, and Fis domain